MANTEPQLTTHTLKEWIDAQCDNHEAQYGAIWRAVAEWVKDSFDHEPANYYTIANVVNHLERCDCAACAAPAGLIYNYDLAKKACEWAEEINECLYDYLDATGENAKPRDGALTIGWLVWFSVEWVAHDFASILQGNAEDGVILENPEVK